MNTADARAARRRWWAVALLICLGARTDPAATPPTRDEIANATFAGIFAAPVTLQGGRYEGEPFVPGGAARPRLLLLSSLTMNGDLDGDRVDEAVAFLAESSAGSGTRLYLAVVRRAEGDGLETATTLIGDRAKVRAARLAGHEIVVDLLQAGQGDAACCPRDLATRTWSWGPDGLSETSQVITGRLSLATLTETRWRLTRLGFRETAPPDAPVFLQVEADGAISGFAGCNTYQGRWEEVESGTLRAGRLATTHKLCPGAAMQLEAAFLERLGAARRFGFLLGQLKLDWRTEDGNSGILMFEPRPDEPSR